MTDEEKALLVTATGIGESLLPELVTYIQKRMKAGSSDPSADFRLMLEAADAAYEEARAAKFGARDTSNPTNDPRLSEAWPKDSK